MSIEDNKRGVQRFIDEVVIDGKTELLDELFAPDCLNHAASAGAQLGIEGLRKVVQFTRTAQPDQRWVSMRVVAEGDMVVVHGVREGTWQLDQFRGIATPIGKRISVELVHIFRIAQGKIAEHWAVRDDLAMMQQLGAVLRV